MKSEDYNLENLEKKFLYDSTDFWFEKTNWNGN